jgi:hypothetical protein
LAPKVGGGGGYELRIRSLGLFENFR